MKQLSLWHSVPDLAADIIRALGDIGDDRAEAVDIVVIMLEKHGSPFVRSEAARSLGKIRSPKAIAALTRRAKQESDTYVKAEILKALRARKPVLLHWKFGAAG